MKRTEQDLEEEEERKRQKELAKGREKVKVVALATEVIDLTEDNVEDFEPMWESLNTDDAENLPPAYELGLQDTVGFHANHSIQLNRVAPLGAWGACSARRRLISRANLDTQQAHGDIEILSWKLNFTPLPNHHFSAQFLDGFQGYGFPREQ